MKITLSTKIFSLILFTLLFSAGSLAQKKGAEKSAPPQEGLKIDRSNTKVERLPKPGSGKANLPKSSTPEDPTKPAKVKLTPPRAGANLEVVFAEGTKALHTVLLYGEDNTFIQDLYHINQLDIMEAIISEAKQFALTEEAVGGAKPLTTRFSNKQTPKFFVDVSKIGRLSRFYITMTGVNGVTLTVDAGTIKRSEAGKAVEESEPILFEKLIGYIQAGKRPAQ